MHLVRGKYYVDFCCYYYLNKAEEKQDSTSWLTEEAQ